MIYVKLLSRALFIIVILTNDLTRDWLKNVIQRGRLIEKMIIDLTNME
jgi:hypothetical protein